MAPFVDLRVVVGGRDSVAFWWNDRRDFMCRQCVAKPIGIEGAVGQQVIGSQVFDQLRHTAQVVGLPRQQTEIREVAQAIGQRQYLGCDTAARPAYGLALSPPFAP